MTADQTVSPGQRQADALKWKEVVLEYQKPSLWRALWQIVNTFGSYGFLWYLMYLSRTVSWWITVPLAVLAGAFLVRVFIIFHDCGHGSFFKSKTANDVTGFICGLLTLTPYYHWRWEHSIHHATAGDLDRRNVGDIWTMTVQEYLESCAGGASRIGWRATRSCCSASRPCFCSSSCSASPQPRRTRGNATRCIS